MRKQRVILASAAVAFAVVTMATVAAQAGDPAVDKRIYDAWVRYVDTLPAAEQVDECNNFIKNYPDNTYIPKVKERLAALKAGKKPGDKPEPPAPAPVPPPAAPPPTAPPPTPTPTPPPTTPPPAPAPTPTPVPGPDEDPGAAAAAAAMSGEEEEAAAALMGGGEEPPPSAGSGRTPKELDFEDPLTGDDDFVELDGEGTTPKAVVDMVSIRKERRLGFGAEVLLGATLGVGVRMAYAVAPPLQLEFGLAVPYLISKNPCNNCGGAPVALEIQAELRFLFMWKRRGSVYLGLGLSGIIGDVDRLEAILNAIDQDPSGWGFAISPAVGYSYTSRKGVGILVQVSERFIVEREGVLGFPTLNVGFRYFL